MGHLGVFMKNGIVNQIQDERHRGVEPTPLLIIRDELLQRAAVEGVPSLSYPAQQYLEQLGGELNEIPNRVVGSNRAYTGPMRPLETDGPSTGMFRWTFGL